MGGQTKSRHSFYLPDAVDIGGCERIRHTYQFTILNIKEDSDRLSLSQFVSEPGCSATFCDDLIFKISQSINSLI